MSKFTIYHNPRCSKSRETLKLLEEGGVEFEVVEYLTNPPSEAELKKIIKMLNVTPREVMRHKEEEYKQQKLDNPKLTANQLIKAMVRTPKLIERPIVVSNGKAVIGRPPENVLEIL